MISFTTTQLRSMPMEELPEVLILGFMPPSPLIERAARVGEYLRQFRRKGKEFELIVDDGREPPIGWQYAASATRYV